jgi:branched-chain amino acid transport system substrate-binding protein
MVLRSSRRLLAARALALGLALAITPAVAQKKYDDGASDTEIRIGNTMPYSGPAAAYGAIGKTIDAFFKKVNDEGGIKGRKITFISYDDGYNPAKTVEMVRKLVEEDKVLLLFQTLGTPTNVAIQKYLSQKQIPQLFVASGASRWNNPKQHPWTMGWQPDYVTEAAAYARDIVAYVKEPRIAVLMQNDDYGKDYLSGFKEGLGKDADMIVQVATFKVTDTSVDDQIVQLASSGANVLFNIATPKFATQAIKKAAEIGWKPVHYLNNVSTSVGGVIKRAGFAAAQGIITTAYLKDPTAPQWAESPDVVAWHAFIDRYLPQADRSSSWYAYGYAVSSTLVEVLRQSGDELTRANIMKQATSLKEFEVPMVLPHLTITTTPTSYKLIQSVRLQRFLGKRWDYSLAAWLAFAAQESRNPQPPQAAPAPAKAAPAKAHPPKAAGSPKRSRKQTAQ